MASRQRPGRSSRAPGVRRAWAIAGLIVFVIVDVALVGGALALTKPQSHGKPGPIPTFSSSPAPTPSPTPSPTSSPTSGAAADITMPTQRRLSAVSATEAWRATPGGCSGPSSSVEHTVDGGVTWTAANTGAYGIRNVVAVEANSAVASVVGGSGDGCTTGLFKSFTTGRFWATYPLGSGAPAYVDPSTAALHLSSGVEQAPCAGPVTVAESTTGTAVLCADGEVFGRAKGASWAKFTVSGALALAANGPGFTIAHAGASGCNGLSIGSLATVTPASPTATSVGCAPVTDVAGIALAQRGSALWLWADTTIHVSTDGGATWRQ